MNPVLRALRQLLLPGLILLAAPGMASDHPVPFAAADYVFHPFGWRAGPDGFLTTGTDAGTADLAKAPASRRVTMESDVLVRHTTDNGDWKTATVAIIRDPENYWHFGLVASPDPESRPNFCELAEMRDGVWNAQGNLKVLRHETPGGPWKPGERYRLRIAMTPETIEGSLHDASGELLERKMFSLEGAPSVRSGRPGLRSRGLTARFTGIRASWDATETAAAAPNTFPPYQSDSFVPDLTSQATGFFRVEQRDGKWWTIDPLGRGTVPLGVDHVRYTGHWCETLGYAPYHRKMQELYPNPGDWVRETAGRLRSWGFNRLGGEASGPMVHQGLSHSRFVGIGTPMAQLGDAFDITPNEGRPCSAFPNVFHPDFDAYCRYQAEVACRPGVGDPWLFGYFLDNELAWWGRGDLETGLFEAVMKKPATHTAKIALRDFLAKQYTQDIEALNTAWGMQLASFDEILGRNHLDGSAPDTVRSDKRAFLALIAELYFAKTTAAIRAIDPGHLILGCRFAGGHASEVVWAAAAKYCDVLSLNYYGNVDLDRGVALDDNHTCRGAPLGTPFAKFATLARHRPLLVTEWSFIALDSGLPCTNGAGQRFRTQAERAKAAGIFAESLLRIPEVIGFDYFMWADEPAQGISTAFPENSNYGLVNGNNEAYQTMVDSLSGVLRRAGQLHREGPRPVPSATPGTAPTPEQLLARLAPDNAPDTSTPVLERHGNDFVIRNGRLTLEGTVGAGPMFRSMRLGDLELGRYAATAHQWVGRNEWPRADTVTAIKAEARGAALVVDITCRFNAVPTDQLRRSFEIIHRIHLLPQSDWFLLELRSYRNLDDQPTHLRSLYFQVFSALGGDTANDQPASLQHVPRLWGVLPGDAWIDETANAYVGITVPRHVPLEGRFWLNDQGGQHPDMHWVTERILPPGGSLVPDQPVYAIISAGRGGRQAWDARHQAPGTDQR